MEISNEATCFNLTLIASVFHGELSFRLIMRNGYVMANYNLFFFFLSNSPLIPQRAVTHVYRYILT